MNYDPNYVIQIIRLMEELSGKHVLSNTNKVIEISTKMKSWNESFAESFKVRVRYQKECIVKQRKTYKTHVIILGLYVLLTLIGCFGLVLSSGGIYLFMMIVFGIQVFTSGYLSQHHNNELIKKEKNWVIFSMII